MQMLIAIASGVNGVAPLGAAGIAPWWHFAGAFHPVVVHFPIALLMVAALLEALTVVRRRSVSSPALSQTALTCLWLGTAGAVAAAVLGWANVNAEGGGMGNDTPLVALHRWTGVALAGVALLAAVASAFARRRPAPRRVLAYRGGVMASAALVGLVGMFGGKITHGADHYDNAVKTLLAELKAPDAGIPTSAEVVTPAAPTTQPSTVAATQPAPAAVAAAADPAPPAGAHDPAAPEVVPATAPTSAPSLTSTTSTASTARLAFARDIKPIFDTACAKCHNAAKQKSGYRLDDRAAAMSPGDSGEKPIVPGHASESFLIKLIEGHGEFADKRMPTKGPPLTGDQIAMIRRWIDDGAE